MTVQRSRVVLSLLIVTVALSPGAAFGKTFKPDCALPFESIKVEHPIDRACGPEGVGTVAPQRAQNRAKNNFCAPGTPPTVAFGEFLDLQKAAETEGIPFGGNRKLPEDRSVLEDVIAAPDGTPLGEGRKIRLAAFVVAAINSNVRNGESVNCKKGGKEMNDIHLALGRKPDDVLCRTLTAEMSPHFRPETWDASSLNSLYHRPVRVTGQLFFDASHAPCEGTTRSSPARASIWEIHPVYAIDVCERTSLGRCRADDDSVWIPLDQWFGLEEEENG